MPDYAEVAGCSSFKNSSSPTYDTFGAYATTTLVGRQFSNNYEQQQQTKNAYSAPNSVHYNNFINSNGGSIGNGNHHVQHQFNHNGNGALSMPNNQLKMNIIENKMEQLMNNLNSPNQANGQPTSATHQIMAKNGSIASKSVPQTPLLSTMRRNRLNNSINGKSNKLTSYSEDGRATAAEQPLFMKSKFDGSWSSIPSINGPNTASTTTSNNNSPSHLPYHHSPRHHPMQSSLNQLNDNNNQPKTNSHSYLSSFGKSDKV